MIVESNIMENWVSKQRNDTMFNLFGQRRMWRDRESSYVHGCYADGPNYWKTFGGRFDMIW